MDEHTVGAPDGADCLKCECGATGGAYHAMRHNAGCQIRAMYSRAISFTPPSETTLLAAERVLRRHAALRASYALHAMDPGAAALATEQAFECQAVADWLARVRLAR